MNDQSMGHVCPPSLVRWLNSPVRKLIQPPGKILGTYVKPGDTVIDLGCGGGFFSVVLAKMVGKNGRVIAVDLQKEMLDITRDFAVRKGVSKRITLHQCKESDLCIANEKVDFAIAFYMVHEVPDRKAFLTQVSNILNPDALFMIIEPAHHVNKSQFAQILKEAEVIGLKQIKSIRLFLSRGVLLGL